ncbi:MAG: S-layer homology domain-containing protein [Clostridiales Family XIII bacterium]|jgi:hypothetical protein|nr:S-layer homology domain-containing protein [Clostridiales Family XIII bacterium]
MRKTIFMRNLSLFIAFIILFASGSVSSVFAASDKVEFDKSKTPSFANLQTDAVGIKELILKVDVSPATTTAQSIKLTLTGQAATVKKFYLTDDKALSKSAINATVAAVTVPTSSGLKWNAVGYIGIVSGSALSAGETVTITATDAYNEKVSDSVVIKVIGSGSGGGGGGGATNPPKNPDDKPKQPDKPTPGPDKSGVDVFRDIKSTDWFYEDVAYAVKNGLFNGISADKFGPNTPMTRGMIVTVLGRLKGVSESSYKDSGFSDVAPGQYYTAYVEWAKANGIVNGVGDNMFAPDRNVSRQDFAVILARYAKLSKNDIKATRNPIAFSDRADIADYAKQAVQDLYSGKIINGVGENAFNPKGSATRAEVAAMLRRFIESSK